MTHHENEQKAADALWGIINPDIHTSVPKDRVVHILDIMIYYATDVPYQINLADDKADQSVTQYLEECKNRTHNLRNDIATRLSDPVHKNEFL